MRLTLKIWRQPNTAAKGAMQTYELDDVSPDMSFLEMLDVLNEKLNAAGEEPIAFDSDCREGICGMCGLMINGQAHGPEVTTTCQLHMRSFKDGDTITIEPWRADAFPVLKDLCVDRVGVRPDDPGRRLHLGEHRLGPGRARDAGARRTNADRAFDAATCIGCGACVAACPNASASLFLGAKITHLGELPQGQAERDERVLEHGRPARPRGLRRLHQHRRVRRGLPEGDPARRDLPAQQGPPQGAAERTPDGPGATAGLDLGVRIPTCPASRRTGLVSGRQPRASAPERRGTDSTRQRAETVDLMEYQAKELFAKHGVTTTLGKVVTTADEARAAAEEIGGVTVVKAQVKAGGRGKAGGVKIAKTPDEAASHAEQILALTIKDLPVNRVLVDAGDAAGGGVLLLLPARPLQPVLPLHRQRRGRRRDRGGRQDQPRRGQEDPDRRRHGRRRRQGPGDRGRGRLPGRAARPGRRHGQGAVEGLRRGGRHPRRGQPAGAPGGRQARGARRQGLARRERRVPSRGPRRVRDPRGDRPARGEGQGQGPQLRQARRPGRHHRQRRGAGHEHPRRRRVRRREARRGQAGQLPRHRRRRQRPGHGRRPRRDPPRRAGQERLRQRLRRHHRLRRGRQRHQGRAGDPRRRGDQAPRRTPRRQQRRARAARSSTS